MPLIEFIAEHRHADDGITIQTYPAGSTADVSEACAASALRMKTGRVPGNGQPGGESGTTPESLSSEPGPAPEPTTPATASPASPKPAPKRASKRPGKKSG